MRYLNLIETALLLACHKNTVRNLMRRGSLKPYRDYRGYYQFLLEDVLRLKDERKQIRPGLNG